MRTIEIYMDKARQLNSLPSDAALSRALGVSVAQPSGWRTRRHWPSDQVMAKLAELAQMDVEQALLDLNQWRTTDDKTRELYARIATRLTGTAAMVGLAVLGACLLLPGHAQAADFIGTIVHKTVPHLDMAMYIMENTCSIDSG